GFIDALRQAGVTPSVSESLDAAAAGASTGVERAGLRETLATTLVKDHADRPIFDAVFDRYFPLPPRPRPAPPADAAARAGEGAEGGGGGGGGAVRGGGRRREGKAGGGQHPREEARAVEAHAREQAARELARRRALLAKPFHAMDAREVETLYDLVAELSRR